MRIYSSNSSRVSRSSVILQAFIIAPELDELILASRHKMLAFSVDSASSNFKLRGEEELTTVQFSAATRQPLDQKRTSNHDRYFVIAKALTSPSSDPSSILIAVPSKVSQ